VLIRVYCDKIISKKYRVIYCFGGFLSFCSSEYTLEYHICLLYITGDGVTVVLVFLFVLCLGRV